MTLAPHAIFRAAALACAITLAPSPARAAWQPEPATSPPVATPAAATDEADPGDLTSLRAEADAAVAASPTATNHHRAGELAERAGDFAAAEASYQAEYDALDPGDAKAREQAAADRKRVRALARGVVADEGPSSHRAELDRAWAAPAKPAEPKPTARPAAPPKAVADDRIVRKWYFWVTLGAIAASAAAVTAIAIKASRDDKPDALDRSGRLRLGATGLRF